MKAKISVLAGVIVLFFMTLWDFSLHLAELLGINDDYMFWIIFPNRDVYNVFWTCYWGTAFAISCFLLVMSSYIVFRSRKSHRKH